MNARSSLDDYLSALLDDEPAAATAPLLASVAAPAPAPAPVVIVPIVTAPPSAVVESPPSVTTPQPEMRTETASVFVPAPAPAPVSTPILPPTSLPRPIFDVPRNTPHSPAQAASIALLQSLAQRNDPMQPHRRASERTTRWLRMRCDEQQYALELLKIQEVVLPGALLPLRGAPPHMLGVMNLRGQIVPVIDLGLYLQRGAIVQDMSTRIVVVEENGEVLGLRVSAVEDVANLTEHQIEPPDTTRVCRITSKLFRGVARVGGRTLILLDASSLLE